MHLCFLAALPAMRLAPQAAALRPATVPAVRAAEPKMQMLDYYRGTRYGYGGDYGGPGRYYGDAAYFDSMYGPGRYDDYAYGPYNSGYYSARGRAWDDFEGPFYDPTYFDSLYYGPLYMEPDYDRRSWYPGW